MSLMTEVIILAQATGVQGWKIPKWEFSRFNILSPAEMSDIIALR